MGERCKVSSFSDMGNKIRRSVESVYVTTIPDKTNGTLVLLADGFGNHINSNLIGKLVCENFIRQYSEMELIKPSKEALSELFLSLHDFVRHKASFFGSPGLKTTLLAIFSWDNQLLIAHSGNTAVFFLSKNAETIISRLTKPSVTMSNEEIPALGMEGELVFEIIEKTLSNGDKLFAVSDGITSVLEEEAIITAIQKNPNASFPKWIVNRANELETEDNSSAIIMEFGSVGSVREVAPTIKKSRPKPVKKEKPPIVQTPKTKRIPGKRPLHKWLGWLLLILLLLFSIWKGYPLLQNWLTSRFTETNPTPVTQTPPEEAPPVTVEPAIQETIVTFQITPNNARVQVFKGNIQSIPSTEQALYDSQGNYTPIHLPPGDYTLFTQSNGYISQTTPIRITEEKETTVSVTLVKIPAPVENKPVAKPPSTIPAKPPIKPPVIPKPPTQPVIPPVVKEWSIPVTSQPSGAKIYINNQFLGLFTPATLKFKPGSYLVTVSKAGYKDQSRNITFTSSAPSFKSIHFTLESSTAFLPGQMLCFTRLSGEAI